eukprot:Skav217833  [mRNA]  locus=scaffold889:526736:534677:+ [translate_table: standard]
MASQKLMQILLLFACLRIGEARKPGPEIAVGTFNSCGLLNKSSFMSHLPQGVYGATETHLTSLGQQRVKSELHHHVPGARISHGHAVKPVSSSVATIGGKASGVAIMSHLPLRALPSQWDPEMWHSSRIHAAAVFADPVWIKLGVCYGFATDPNSVQTIEATDKLLAQLTQRIVYDAKGPRAIVGDFNNAKLPFKQLAVWKREGFVDLQTWAAEAWGHQIQPTSQHTSTIDHVWVSKELLPFLKRVEIEATLFPNHSVVAGIFDGFKALQSIQVWPKALAIPWDVIDASDLHTDDLAKPSAKATSQEVYRSILTRMETAVDRQLQAKGKPKLLPQQKGRATVLGPSQRKMPIVPLKRSRANEVEITFMGEQFHHVQWCRQVRRLQSLLHSFRSAPCSNLRNQQELLWKSIKAAPGFPGGFAKMWLQRTVVLPNSPGCLPRRLPSEAIVNCIFCTVKAQFQQLEKELNHARLTSAKQRRSSNPNVVYRDVARQQSLPVQTVVTSRVVTITEVTDDGLQIHYEPPTLDSNVPVWSEHGLITTASHEPGILTLPTKQGVEEGQVLRQESNVDNWEATCDQAKHIPTTLKAFEEFAHLADLALDAGKTYVWALNPTSRTALKAAKLNVSLSEKDLGGHMNYSRRNTIASIKSRIKSHAELWTWIARSTATEAQKLKVVATVAWPRCLHGITGTYIGPDHYAKLRSACMSALGWQKKGANPQVQLGLKPHPHADPAYWALKQTVLNMRKQAYLSHEVFAIVDRVCQANPVRYQQGPAGAFLQRIHSIGWRWEGQGWIQDHEQFQWHLLGSPFKAVLTRLEHAWHKAVASQINSRDSFQGIHAVDVPATFRHMHKRPADHQGLLRTALNGTFYTRDKLVHTGKVPDGICQWCSQPDSTHHRNWECQGFQTMRPCTLEQVPQPLNEVACLVDRGWCIEPPSFVAFRRALCEQPDLADVFETMPLEDDYAVHLFTDGSAAFPTKPAIRLSSWAVVQADLKADEFQLVALGGVPGFIQTSPRAELTAVISAFLFGVKFCNLFYIWTDCQLVVDGIRDFASHGPPSAATADHDLWDRLWNLWKQATQVGQLGKIIKLRSHQEPSVYSDVIERWAIRGNDAADHWAERARTALPPPLREAHAQAVRDFRLQSAAQEKVHSTLCAVGMHSVETKQARRQSDDQVLEEVDREADPQAQVSFCPLPSSCPDGGSALGANAELLFRGGRLSAKMGDIVRAAYTLPGHHWPRRIIIEKLRSVAAELQPTRVVFVDLRTADPVIACEGRKFSSDEGGLDLRQLGYESSMAGDLGRCHRFAQQTICITCHCLGELQDEDNIYVDVVSAFPDAPEGMGGLIFGVRRGEEDAQVAAAGAWIPGQAHLYLFTVSQRQGKWEAFSLAEHDV